MHNMHMATYRQLLCNVHACVCVYLLYLNVQCSGVYTAVEPMDGNVMCAEDTDGDGISNSEVAFNYSFVATHACTNVRMYRHMH